MVFYGQCFGTKIENCVNNASITAANSAGGIIGGVQSNGDTIITYCYNTGNVKNLTSGSVNGAYMSGGILGWASCLDDAKMTINNCYNIGNIGGYKMGGGILGSFAGNGNFEIINCYNKGTITGTTKGGIAGSKNTNSGTPKLNFLNNYWLKTCGASYAMMINVSSSGTNSGATPVDEATLKSYATVLGASFTSDIQNEDGTWKYNNGYPILKWQIE